MPCKNKKWETETDYFISISHNLKILELKI